MACNYQKLLNCPPDCQADMTHLSQGDCEKNEFFLGLVSQCPKCLKGIMVPSEDVELVCGSCRHKEVVTVV